ncbi:hypothetical protein J2Z26_003068 [Bacillus luteolus]|nr:hypothetical protein [Cytobacillus luteolus]
MIVYCYFLSRVTMYRNSDRYNDERFVARNNSTIFFWFIILLAFASLKGENVGVDYPMYYGFFLQENYHALLEPGINFIYDIAVHFDSFYIFAASVYFLFLFFILLGIWRNSPNYLISIFLFIIMHIYYNAFNQIRQLIAVSIIFCFAHILVSNKKLDKLIYFSILLLALLFHNSAIFLFILFFLPKKTFHPKVVIPLFVVTAVLYFIPSVKNQIGELIISISGTYGEKYSQGTYNFFGVNKEKGLMQFIPVVIQMFIVSCSLYLTKSKANLHINDRLYQFSTNAVVVNLCLYSLAGIEAIDRLQIYFSCFNIYYYSYLLHILFNYENKLIGQLFACFIVSFWILYYILRLMINVHGVVPYKLFI